MILYALGFVTMLALLLIMEQPFLLAFLIVYVLIPVLLLPLYFRTVTKTSFRTYCPASYVEKEQELVRKMERLESIELSPNFDYNGLQSLSLEAREKLSKVKPRTLGQASRISGVSPADISVLLVFLGR